MQKDLASSQLTVKSVGQLAEIPRIIAGDPHLKLASCDGTVEGTEIKWAFLNDGCLR